MKCAECRFFDRDTRVGLETCGFCKRNSPSPAYVQGGITLIVGFPLLEENQWCGDYQPRQ
jgi:hypothetical protein